MSLVQDDMGSFIHGVSQQSDERLAKGQVREQINCRSHITRGLTTRAGFQLVGKLIPDIGSGGSLDNAKWTTQQRGDGKDFLVGYDLTRPAVFDLDAVAKVFSFSAASAETYYQSGVTDPTVDYGIDAVLDTTFVTNRTVVPLGDNLVDLVVDPPRVTWIEFKVLQPGTEIEITFATIGSGSYITTVFDSYVTVDPGTGVPDPVEAARAKEFEGSYHAEQFVIQAADANVTSYNNWVRIGDPDANEVTIVKGGESIKLHENKSIDTVEVIPAFAITGDVVKIEAGRGEERNLGYFTANSKTSSSSMSEVSWDETIAPGSSGVFDASTMPHRLVRGVGDVFVLEPIPWKDRQVGDKDSNPYPTFIQAGTPINNLGVFQNRLFSTSSETVLLSASDAFFDLWRESAFYNTDADPFERFADTKELNILQYAEEFDGDLVLFSETGQFLMSGDINHTYQTAYIQSVSQFKVNLKAAPVLSGDNIFFSFNYGNFAGVREFYTDSVNQTKRAMPTTQHVDEYMLGTMEHLATSINVNALCSLLSRLGNEVFIYEWSRDVNFQLLQQSWHRWILQEGVIVEWVGFVESKLCAVVKLTDETETAHYLWSLSWDDPPETHGLDFSIRLDGRFEVQGVNVTYDSGTDKSTWQSPYDRADLVFVEGPESDDPGFEALATRTAPYTWESEGDISGVKLIGGLRYRSLVEFPNPQMKDRNGVTKSIDRLQIAKYFLRFRKVGQVTISITDKHGREKEHTFNNRRMNNLNNQASKINTEAAKWDFPIRKKILGLTVTLYTDDVTPFTLDALEWRGDYKQKGRR